VDFWPKRVIPDLTQTIYVHLSIPERAPIAHAQCGRKVYELGPPTWSHSGKLLHAFDLEWSLPRRRVTCDLIVFGGSQRTYVGSHRLVVRSRGTERRVDYVHPLEAPVDGDTVVEIAGAGFSPLVSVIWVAAGHYRKYERSVSTFGPSQSSELVVPFAPALADAPAGEYLLIVENEDRSAIVLPEPFTVYQRDGDVEFERTRLVQLGSSLYLAVEGFGLEDVERARIALPSSGFDATVIAQEGSVLPGVLVELPPNHGLAMAALSGLSLEDGELRIDFSESSRLTGKPPEKK